MRNELVISHYLAVKLLICLCAYAVLSRAQFSGTGPNLARKVFGPITVETPEGELSLDNVRLWEKSFIREALIGPRVSGHMENKTGTYWEKLLLKLRFRCPGESERETELFFYKVAANHQGAFHSDLSDADPACDADLISVMFDRGVSERQKEREAAAREAEETRRSKEEADREAASISEMLKDAGGSAITLTVPKGRKGWRAVGECADALSLFSDRGKMDEQIDRAAPGHVFQYEDGRKVVLLGRYGGCAGVQFFPQQIEDFFVASSLAPPSSKERAAAARAAAEKKDRANREEAEKRDRADHEAALAKLPRLEDDSASAIFIGNDKKCSEQFVQALGMDGLEKRKRIADLVSYGCGFLDDAGVHVTRVGMEGGSCLVRIENGRHVKETGWVPCTWVRQ